RMKKAPPMRGVARWGRPSRPDVARHEQRGALYKSSLRRSPWEAPTDGSRVRCRRVPYSSGAPWGPGILLPQPRRDFPGFFVTLDRKARKTTIFTPTCSWAGDHSRCNLEDPFGSPCSHADCGDSASVCVGGPGGFALPGDAPPLSRGDPRLLGPAGSAAGAGTRAGRLCRLPPLGGRRAHTALATSLLLRLPRRSPPQPRAASTPRGPDRGADPPSLESLAVPRRSGAPRPPGRDAGEFRCDGSAVGRGGARPGTAHRRRRHGAVGAAWGR